MKAIFASLLLLVSLQASAQKHMLDFNADTLLLQEAAFAVAEIFIISLP